MALRLGICTVYQRLHGPLFRPKFSRKRELTPAQLARPRGVLVVQESFGPVAADPGPVSPALVLPEKAGVPDGEPERVQLRREHPLVEGARQVLPAELEVPEEPPPLGPHPAGLQFGLDGGEGEGVRGPQGRPLCRLVEPGGQPRSRLVICDDRVAPVVNPALAAARVELGVDGGAWANWGAALRREVDPVRGAAIPGAQQRRSPVEGEHRAHHFESEAQVALLHLLLRKNGSYISPSFKCFQEAHKGRIWVLKVGYHSI
eukprot:CAMPEP_0172625328 /NCGR_PEP_ID=MMETSP1068-20121228/143097_1 /TAXON_ID=35684 /ORGANISM="Pseudopedinella elastica, Strain CCMP716" /LENGTH=259 /DNA_ID=CAMNT_0013434585 /DNA_START=201 /DNA_END=981 /DNA_ORIENTATION=-